MTKTPKKPKTVKEAKEPREAKPTKINVDVPRTPEQNRMALKRKVSIFYDLQRLRIQTAGRTYERADGTEIQLHEVDVAVLEMRSKELETAERHALHDVEDHLKTIKFYRDVLSDKARYRGIGPTMAGVILSSFDIAREDTPSKMWSFAGLAPVNALRCRECHSVVDQKDGGLVHRAARVFGPKKPGEVEPPKPSKCSKSTNCTRADLYESGEAMRPQKGEKLPYNSFLRTKLVGVLGPVMLKVGSPWKKAYDDYKHRKASAGWGKSDAHRHQAAIRFMIKMVLLDIWREWRTAEELPVRPSYHEEKLGHQHSATGFGRHPTTNGHAEAVDPEVAAELEQVLA